MRIFKSSSLILLLLCALLAPFALADEKDYSGLIDLLSSAMNDPKNIFKHSAYQTLAEISDTFGPRMWGSDALERAIQAMYSKASKEGFDNPHLEKVGPFVRWVRGKETLTLLSPRPFAQKLDLIGLGGTIAGNFTREAVVVSSWDELDSLKDQIAGKIVVYNEKWTNYYQTVDYRVNGADRAAAYGAVAALVRSVTSKSIYSVHAGGQFSIKIPVAAITVEDAQMMARMQARGQKIILHLQLENSRVEDSYSSNLVFEIRGSVHPEQILLMGGHIDSWDTGSQTGANDDGGGFVTCFEAMRLLLKNGLRPKRTIRFVAWSGEEWADPQNGNKAYLKSHYQELDNHIVAFEDDQGSTKLLGFGFSGDQDGLSVVRDVASKYLGKLNASLVSNDGMAVDTQPLFEHGVPIMKNLIKDNASHDYYFKYHHSAGDTMSIMNADDLDSNVLGLASMFFILADLEDTIPRPAPERGHVNLQVTHLREDVDIIF